MFTKLKLRTKLFIGFGVVIVLLMILSIYIIIDLNTTQTLRKENNNISESIRRFLVAENGHYIWMSDVKDYLFIDSENELNVETDHKLCKLGEFIFSEDLHNMLGKHKEVLTIIDNIKQPHKELHDSAIEIQNASSIQEKQSIFLNTSVDKMEVIRTYLEQIRTLLNNQIVENEKNLQDRNTQSFIMTLSIAGASIIIAILISILISRSVYKTLGGEPHFLADITDKVSHGILEIDDMHINKNSHKTGLYANMMNMVEELKDKSNVIRDISEGNLNVKVKLASEEDEVGISLLNMVENLNDMLKQIYEAAQQITSGTDQLSSASEDLSKGATNQAASLEEVSASISEISGQIQGNTENAISSAKGAEDARTNAEKGNQQMKELLTAMNEISKSAKDIRQIVSVIDDIAFQTNLLALNADIEAARVGKFGKGFAVVANSVRNLATKSQKSVKETTHLVDNALKNIERGNKLTEITSQQLDDIVNTSMEVNQLANEVAEGSQEQTRGIEQIGTALSQVEEVVQSNSASAEENASTTEQLAAQAKSLLEIVSNFNLKEIEKNTVKQLDSGKYNNSNGRDKNKKEIAVYSKQ